MEAISDNHGEMNWDNKTTVAANGLSKMCHSFFIVSFVVTTNAMSIIKPITVKLQYTIVCPS